MKREKHVEITLFQGEFLGMQELAKKSGLKLATWLRAIALRELRRKSEEPF